MANEVQFHYSVSGRTLRFLVWNAAGQVWNGAAFVAYVTANLNTYAQTMTEVSTSGRYHGTFPAAIAADAFYNIVILDRAGGVLAESDPAVGGGDLWWDGTLLTPSPTDIGAGTGTGARTVTVTVTGNAVPIEGATVRLTKGGESYVGSTNVAGQIVFMVDDGTWAVSITAVGFSFAGATIVVDGNEAVAYDLAPITLNPSPPGLTTGFLTCLDPTGNAEANVSVTCIVREPSESYGAALDSTSRTQQSAGNGLVQFTGLVKGATYSFKRGTSAKEYIVQIPADAGDTYALPSIIGAP